MRKDTVAENCMRRLLEAPINMTGWFDINFWYYASNALL